MRDDTGPGSDVIDVFAVKHGTLQPLTAVEAFHHFGCDPERTVLIVMRQLAGSPCLEDAPFGTVVHVDGTVSGPWRRRRDQVRQHRYRTAVLKAVAGRPVRDLYLGLYSKETRALANRLRPDRITILDDGTSTVYRSAERVRDLHESHPSRTQRLLGACASSAGLDSTHLPTLRFFTVFEPELMPGDEHVRADLAYFRQKLGRTDVDPALAWILGTNLVAAGHLDGLLYEQMLRSVIRRLTEGVGQPPRIEYHPHPRERDEDAQTLCAELGMELATSSSPIELKLLACPAMPGAGIWSFPSSALVTTSLMLEGSVPCTMISVKDSATWAPIHSVESTVRDHVSGVAVLRLPSP